MNQKMKEIKNSNYWMEILLAFIIIVVSVVLIEKGHILRCAVKDDVDTVKFFLSQRMGGILFTGGYKYRPVTSLAMWVVAWITSGNEYLYGWILLILQMIWALIIFGLVRKGTKSFGYAILSVLLYTTSRFSYYQITQHLGIMEGIALILAICFVWKTIKFLETRDMKDLYMALFFYFLVSMSHERYCALMPVLLFAWFVVAKQNKLNIKTWAFWKVVFVIIFVFAAIMILFSLLVNNIMTGAGGTNVTETFSIGLWIRNFLAAIIDLLGVNAPEEYLTMLSWTRYTRGAKVIVLLSILALFVIIICSIIDLIRAETNERKECLTKCSVFFLSIGAMFFMASITIRVEIRWLYCPYMVAVFLLIQLVQFKAGKKSYIIKHICLSVYLVSMILFSVYARRYYFNLYYWPEYTIANELADETYGILGEEMYDKEWVIISSSDYSIYYESMLQQFDPRDEYNLELEIVPTLNDLKTITKINDKEILWYNEMECDFQNVTNLIK